MRLRGTVIGALNVFQHDTTPLDAADVAAGQAMADIGTIAILHRRAAVEAQLLNEQLTHALNSRIVIEQAKGVLAERCDVTMDEAFDRLRRHARSHNLLLSDVAEHVIDGTLLAAALGP
jgi:AmiR/NasT family two-component response regulator